MSYRVKRAFSFAAAHYLRLDYSSPCARLHGHNWNVVVSVEAPRLDANGMVCDFSRIKQTVVERFDHRSLNDDVEALATTNPTAENIAKTIADWLDAELRFAGNGAFVRRVDVEESPGSVASFVRDAAETEAERKTEAEAAR